ncbi:biotin transporter BioY [Alkalihalobacterium chitinilyticum]|uniref:Biotin transporter n=1 Tax=Alkalihalobacterium chitinilyticum TaxID=2980103 RepID=A0ABT5V9S7_9BACI|nr:biotin transporter BioY [Alkalihalobacterium chitinilyticum]MDE5412035.1 biotin transporter BioY [Alkalihalobacterium chitinilyticum]
MKLRPIDISIAGLFVALMAIGANVAPYLTIGGVPITLQLLFAIFAGVLLGSRLAAISMTAYMVVGLIGVPVFAQFKGGFATLLGPTFGFVVSFIFVAYAAGKLVEAKVNPKLPTFFMASFIGVILNYVIGTHWMYVAFLFWLETHEGFSYLVAWSWMLLYLPLDIAVAVFAAVISPRMYKAVKRTRLTQKQRAA